MVGTSCSGTITRTYTITDACGNTSSVDEVFTVTDNTAPTLTGAPYSGTTGTNDCMSAAATAAPFNAANAVQGWVDNCSATVTATLTDTQVSGTDCSWTVTYTYNVSDGCGNSSTGTYSNTGGDYTVPVVVAPTTSDLECESDLPAAETTIAGFNALPGASASDNCTATANLTVSSVTGPLVGTNCSGTITRTYTITDACGNTSSVDQVFTVTDNTAPVVVAPTTSDLECESDLPAAQTTIAGFNALPGASASDNCTATANLTVSSVTGPLVGTNCSGTITRTYTITDACGNTSSVDEVFTVTDNTAPTLTGAPYSGTTGTNDCMSAAATAAPFNAANAVQGWVDNCSATVTATLTDTQVSGTDCSWTVTYTYNVSDGCGNSSTGTYSNTGGDYTVPVVVAPTTSDLECESDLPAAETTIAGFNALPGASASDNCTATANLTVSSVTGPLVGTNCSGTITRTYTITDACGNTSSVDQVFTVTDNTAPVVVAPTTSDLECESDLPAAQTTIAGFNALPGASASDNCTATANLTVSSVTGPLVGTNCSGTITRTYTITDACGNTSSVDEVFTVTDNTAPTLTGAPYSGTTGTNDCMSAAATAAPFNAANAVQGWVDNCSATVTATLTDTQVSGTDCSWTVTYTYNVSDACGNSSTGTYSNTGGDYTVPVVVAPTTSDLECESDLPAAETTIAGFNALPGASASDNCTATANLTVSSVTGPLVGTNCSGTITRTYTITDACGNTSSVDQVFTVTDNTAPVVVAPTTSDLECESDLPAAQTTIAGFNALPGASASDNCTATANLTVSSVTGPLVGTNCSGTITRTYTITDACGNTSSVDEVFTVTDNTAPVVAAPTTSDLECESDLPAAETTIAGFNALPGASASDNCTATANLTVSSVTGPLVGTNCSGTITRTYTITDACGNTSSVDQVFTITDNTAPVVVAPTTSDLECESDLPAAETTIAGFNALPGASASDNCTATANLTVSSVTGPLVGTNCSGTITRTYTITDACGNTSSVDQVFTVTDNTAPVVVAPTTSDLECESDLPAAQTTIAGFNALPGASASDNCTATANLTVSSVTGPLVGTNCSGTITRTYTITDACGNTSSVDEVFTVTDNTAPTLTGAPYSGTTGTNDCMSAAATAAPFNAANAVQGWVDNCSATVTATLTDTQVSGTDCSWTVTYTYNVSDGCGNSSTGTYSNTGGDYTVPVVVAPTTSDLECESDLPAAETTIAGFNALPGASASDNCTATANLTVSSVTGPLVGTNCSGTITRTYTITDACGNTSSVDQVFTVTDNTAPVVVAPTTSDLECESDLPAAQTTIAGFNALPGASASDNCTATANLTVSSVTGPLVGTNCSGTITRTYTITDACGNTSSVDEVFTVTDNTAPTLTGAPYSGTTGTNACMADAATAAPFNASNAVQGWVDNCSATVTATLTDTQVTGTNCSWTVTYTYNVSDACGNSSTGTYFNTGGDKTGPVLTPPGTQTLNVGAGAGCTVTMPDYRPLVTAVDGCGGTVTLQQLAPNAPGSLVIGYGGSRTITFIGTDACGNTSTTSFQLNLVDATAPNALCKNITVDLNASGNATITPAMVNNGSNDNCSSVILVSVFPNTFNCSNVGPNTVTLTVRDAAGNTSTCQSIVTVRDLIAPVVTCFGDTTIAKGPDCSNILDDFTNRINVSDACGGLTVTQNIPAGTILGASVQFVDITLTVTDANGNSSTCGFRVNYADQTAPVINNCPSNITVYTGTGNAQCSQTATWTAPTVTDNCGGFSVPDLVSTHNPGDVFPVGTTTVTYTATDGAGNTATCSFTVTVVDDTKPTISGCPVNINLTSSTGNPATCTQIATWTAPTAADNCGVLSLTSTHNSGDAFPVGTTTVTYTATDIHGNTETCSFTVTVVDDTKPTISGCPANITLTSQTGNPATCTQIATWTAPTAADNCAVASLTSTHNSGDAFPVGTTTVTYTATDVNGNTETCSFTVTVVDDTKPTISGCPANITLTSQTGNPATCTQIATWTAPTAADNCGVLSLTSTHNSGDAFPVGTTTVTYTATDVNGNTETCSFTVTVVDDTKPTISGCPANITLTSQTGNPATCTQIATWTAPTAADNCAVASLTSTHNSGDAFPVGTTTVTYTATDVNGNTETCSFTVTVVDDTKPTISGCPANITLTSQTGNPATCTQIATWTAPTAADNCAVASLTSTHNSGDAFPVGTTTVTYTATDVNGNTETCSFTVTVIDDTKPTISGCPANITLTSETGNPATCTQIATWTAPTAADNCAIASLTSTHNSGDAFPVGVTTVTYTATDVNGNTETCSFTVTVVDDTKPTISGCPADITVNTGSGNTQCAQTATWTAPTAADNCAIASLTSTHNSGDAFPVGTTTVTYTATDVNGNTQTCSFTVTVVDDTKPTITGCPADITVTSETGNPATCTQIATWTAPTAADNCGVASLTSTHNSGDAFPVGTTTVTYTATDIHGNTETCSFTVTVTDDTKPTITGCPADITVNTGSGNTQCSQTATWTEPLVGDNCGVLSLTSTHNSGDVFPVGTTTVTYTATDVNGNTQTCSFTVTVVDDTKPVFTFCPSPVINAPTNAAGCVATIVTSNPMVADNCSAISSLTWALTGATTDASAGSGINYLGTYNFNVGTTTVTYTATDAAGNTQTCIFTVTVVNNLSGTISGTATVAQNGATTSNITFTGSGGVKPYTFTYNVSYNGGPAGANQTVSTTGSNSVVTVPQSNAVLGTYKYTLVSVTDANGCPGTLPAPPANAATITVVTAITNLSPSAFMDNFNFNAASVGVNRDFIIEIDEIAGAASSGTITLRIQQAFGIQYQL